jgi:hypothetical protein
MFFYVCTRFLIIGGDKVAKLNLPAIHFLFVGVYLILLSIGIYMFFLIVKFLKKAMKALDVYIDNNSKKGK